MLKRFGLITLCALCGSFAVPSADALTRVPTPGTGESSLLYWRYLCRGQPQEQVIRSGKRELSCASQRWRVRTKPSEDRVVEVVEDAS